MTWLRRLRELVRRWTTPPRTLKVTSLGRTYLVLTFGIGLGALNTGNNLLYLLLGFLLSMIVMSGVLSERVLRDVTVRRLLPSGVFAREPFPLRYELARSAGHGFALQIEELGGAIIASAFVGHVTAGQPEVVRADAVAARRGPLKLSAVSITTTFPLGIFAKSRRLDLPEALVVYPARGFACAPPLGGAGVQESERGTSDSRNGTGELHGLRELGPTDDARRIHWKKSAAVGRLMRVEREREDRLRYALALKSLEPGEALERECEELAAMSLLLLSAGHEVGLTAGQRQIRPSGGPGQERRLLVALAMAGFDEEAGTP